MRLPVQRKFRHTITRLLQYTTRHGGTRGVLLCIAIVIGIMAAAAAAVLHWLVHTLAEFAMRIQTGAVTTRDWKYVLLFFLLPLFGIALSYLAQRLFGGARYAKSLSPLVLALSRRKTAIPFQETFSHILSSGLSVGLGGSAGLEAPSVLTGAALGANTARYLRITPKHRTLLLACGCAAAISAIFNSPIAGVLFTAEVLLPEFSVSALVPMVMSSAVAAVTSRVLMGSIAFFPASQAPYHTEEVPYFFLCGVVCALVGVYIIRAAYHAGALLKKKFRQPLIRLAVGGLMLAILLVCVPVLRGQGYSMIAALFRIGNGALNFTDSNSWQYWPENPWLILLLLAVVVLLKVIATVLTVESGGDGGIFAPSLFMGAVTGFTFAQAVNMTGIIQLQVVNFIAVGMCGVFSAVMRAPLTGIFLIAEVTGGYILLVPLMIVSSVSCFIARFAEPNSIYHKVLVENKFLDNDRDQSMLRRLSVRQNVIRRYHPLAENAPLEEVIEMVENTGDEIYPVLDSAGKLLGVVYLQRILSTMLNKDVYSHLLVFDLMETPRCILRPEDDLAVAMKGFEMCKMDSLPVCLSDGTFQGIVHKDPIFAQYRKLVRDADSF